MMRRSRLILTAEILLVAVSLHGVVSAEAKRAAVLEEFERPGSEPTVTLMTVVGDEEEQHMIPGELDCRRGSVADFTTDAEYLVSYYLR